MDFVIRRMTQGEEAGFDDVADGVFDEPINHSRLTAYLTTPGHLMLLAFDGKRVVGQCAAVIHRHPDKPDELYIDEVGTADAYLRRGIATALMNAMFEWGRELGCEEAWLGTELDNTEANALYRKFSPSEDETIQYYLFSLGT